MKKRSDLHFDKYTDILVLGANPFGMTAALAASWKQASVTVLEESPFYGGIDLDPKGILWIPGNHLMADLNYMEDHAQVREHLEALIGPAISKEKRTIFARYAPEMIYFLEKHSDLRFRPITDLEDGSVKGRQLKPIPFPARKLRSMIREMDPSLRLEAASVQEAQEKNENQEKKWHPILSSILGGNRLTGSGASAGGLRHALHKAKIPVEHNCEWMRPIGENGRIVGVCYEQEGKRVRIRAEKGVIASSYEMWNDTTYIDGQGRACDGEERRIPGYYAPHGKTLPVPKELPEIAAAIRMTFAYLAALHASNLPRVKWKEAASLDRT